MKKEMLRNETYMLSVYTSLWRVNLIIPRQRGTKWIIKKTVCRLNASLADKAIKFSRFKCDTTVVCNTQSNIVIKSSGKQRERKRKKERERERESFRYT